MQAKHLSSQFDKELNKISSSIMTMAGYVEDELKLLVQIFSAEQHERVLRELAKNKQKLEELEIKLDSRLVTVILRRQPTAIDLRLLVGVSKVLMYLSNINVEVEKITGHAAAVYQSKRKTALPLAAVNQMLVAILQKLQSTLDYFARLDVDGAVQLLCQGNFIAADFNSFVRELITYIMEEVKAISCGLDLVVMVKSAERIAQQILGINQQIIYIVKGINVSHADKDKLLSLLENDVSAETTVTDEKSDN